MRTASRACPREALTSRAALRRRRPAWAERLEARARTSELPSSSPLEHPGHQPLRCGRIGDSSRSEKRPKTSVRRRPAKSDALEEIEVLSTAPESGARRERLTPPSTGPNRAPLHAALTVALSRWGDLRALLQGAAPLCPTPRCLALTSQAPWVARSAVPKDVHPPVTADRSARIGFYDRFRSPA